MARNRADQTQKVQLLSSAQWLAGRLLFSRRRSGQRLCWRCSSQPLLPAKEREKRSHNEVRAQADDSDSRFISPQSSSSQSHQGLTPLKKDWVFLFFFLFSAHFVIWPFLVVDSGFCSVQRKTGLPNGPDSRVNLWFNHIQKTRKNYKHFEIVHLSY